MNLAYRKDIDGLRAIAILSVLFFHSGIPLFEGGFTGVDIFFVISGYLISSTIRNEISDKGYFCILNFYERRIRRIFPALLFVLFFTSVTAYIWLLPPDFRNYGQTLVASILSFSNILFWKQTSYFSTIVFEKPLLHTWSLGVEEQFYLVFPALILLLLKAKIYQRHVVGIIGALLIMSLAACIFTTPHMPELAFFMPFTRAWELMTGSLLAFATVRSPSQVKATIAGSLGFLLILFPVFLFKPTTEFPGYNALMPCIGAALIIYAGQEKNNIVSRLLSVPPLVFTGLISYSLYLWHWPIFAFYNYIVYRELTYPEIVSLITLSYICAIFCWAYIERPFRNRGFLSRARIFTYSFLSACLVIGAGVFFHLEKGVPSRFDLQTNYAIEAKNQSNPLHGACLLEGNDSNLPQEQPCIFGQKDKTPSIIVWGDSHADHLIPGIAAVAAKKMVTGREIAKSGCPPLVGAVVAENFSPTKQDCGDFNKNVLDFILNDPTIKTVILAARWSLYAETTNKGLGNPLHRTYLLDEKSASRSPENSQRVLDERLEFTIRTLKSHHKKVILIGPIPEQDYRIPQCLARSYDSRFGSRYCPAPSTADVRKREKAARDILARVASTNHVRFYDPGKFLCNEESCAITLKQKPLYMDDNHLSIWGSAFLMEKFEF